MITLFKSVFCSLAWDFGRIFAIEASGAEAFTSIGYLQEVVNAEVAQGIDADDVGDFVNGVVIGNEVFRAVNVRAVVARRDERWGTDTHVDFFSTGLTQKSNGASASRATHDGIVNKDDSFSFDEAANRIELDVDTNFTLFLGWRDKGAPDVFVFSKADAERNAGSIGIA